MTDDELRALLRGADPAASLPPADPRRVADLLEDAVSTTRPTPAAPAPDLAQEQPLRRRPRPFVVAMAAAAVAVVAAAVAVPVVRSLTVPAAPEVTTTLSAQPFDPVTASCAGVAVTLTQVDTAFAGRVAEVDGDRVLIDVTTVYRGAPGDRVAIDAPNQDELSGALIGGFPFEAGGDYLVAATGGMVAVCGASGPADPALQAEYDTAFG